MQIKLNLNGYLKVESRTRYSVWDLLGDVGGLHDGLVIFCAIFVVPFSTFSFSNDYITGKLVDDSNRQHDRAFQSSARFLGVVKKISSGANAKVDPDTLDIIAKAIRSARKFKSTIQDAIKELFCQHKRRRNIKSRMVDHMDQMLDVRQLIQS